MSAATRMSAGEEDGTVKQRSGWIIPIAVFLVTAGLSAIFLLYYLVPTPASFIEEHPAPTSRTDPISLSVGGLKLTVPANYIIYARSRQGGPQRQLELFTTFPDFHGYSYWYASDFTGNAPDSPAIFMLVRQDQFKISEADRLSRIYMEYVTNRKGAPGPFGLTQYTFRDDSGYHAEDLFVGQVDGQPVVLRCVRFSIQVPSPSCLRDMRLQHGITLSYRFKRAHLGHWAEIAQGIKTLAASFGAKTK